MVLVIGVASFSIVSFAISWAVGKRGKVIDGGELSFSVLLIAWGAMFYGLFVARL